MNDNKNQQPRSEGAGNQNPTLNNPGSKVADYGNPTGGSATENTSQNKQGRNPQRGNASTEENTNDTIGNP